MKPVSEMTRLELAVLVAHDNDVDLREIRRWSEREGKLPEFERIKARLRRPRPRPS